MKSAYDGEIAVNRTDHLAINKQITEVDGELQVLKENLLVKMEEIRSRMDVFEAEQKQLDSNLENFRTEAANSSEQHKDGLSNIEDVINKMKDDLSELELMVRAKGGEEQEDQSAKIMRLDELLEVQSTLGEKIRVLEDLVRNLEESVSKNYQEQIEQVIKLSEEQGKLSGNLTERWGALDINIGNIKTTFKKDIDEKRSTLEQAITDISTQLRSNLVVLEAKLTDMKEDFSKRLDLMEVDIEAKSSAVEENMLSQVSQVNLTINKLGSDEVSVAIQNVRSFKARITELERRVMDMNNTIEEYPREWKNNLLFHGVESTDEETFYTLAAVVSRIIRRQLGIRREMMITGIVRLTPSRADIGGVPPLAVSLQQPRDREEVLSRIDLLKGANIKITEDMPRCLREQWGELHKFMLKVKEKYPSSVCILQEERLYVDTKVFVWDRAKERVLEQPGIVITPTGNIIQSNHNKSFRK